MTKVSVDHALTYNVLFEALEMVVLGEGAA